MKRLLFEAHRWGGIALALFMTLWFFSGLVIIYAEPTAPGRAGQLAHAEALQPKPTWLSAGEAWQRSAEQRRELASHTAIKPVAKKPDAENGKIVEARLLMQADEPVWLIEDARAQHFALSAIDGKLHETSVQQALRIAANWINKDDADPAVNIDYVETIEKPAILRNREALRPFHRIAVEDGNGTELLISARTGEVADASTRFERGLYWAGNWLHLFRPLELTRFAGSRVDVLTWTAFAAVAVLITGLIVGWLRWRPGFNGRKTYSEGRTHPYRDFYSRWHFRAGLIGGVLALTWGLSGFLNNNPWKLFSPANPAKEELARYVGGANPDLAKSWQPAPLHNNAAVVELVWRRLGDESVRLAYARDGKLSETDSTHGFSQDTLRDAVQRMAGDIPIAKLTLLQEYDSYYYLRHHRDVAERPLPVLRVELADAAGTHLYIDPQDGRLLIKQDKSRRIFRWLYSALHHWDIGFLYQHPLWDAWMLSWVLFGLVLSTTSVVLGYKRLKSTFRPKKRAARTKLIQPVESPGLTTENQAG
ncbi:MAG: PepSY domain-containing protein [Gallionella sp.]|jgi:uncharacterized iron-regulated membrane protein